MKTMKPELLNPKTIAALPAVFTHVSSVRFQDVDAAGVVFFARIFDYFHDAYVAYLAKHGLPLDRVLTSADWGLPIRHAEADYFHPMRFGDEIAVELVGALAADSEVRIAYRIAGDSSGGSPRVLAVGHTRHVAISRSSDTPGRIAVPPALARALEPLTTAADGWSP